MKIEVFTDVHSVTRQAAALIAAEARAAVAARDRFVMAVSDGDASWIMPVFDLIRLSLGPEGHTASLVPGDPVLEINDADVGITEVYQKRRRMTLTYPILNRARRILWLVTGSEKTGMLDRLLKADTSIPAGRVNQARAVVFADRAAAKNVHLGVKDYEAFEEFAGQS
jgi:6-phosphogluconolactonase